MSTPMLAAATRADVLSRPVEHLMHDMRLRLNTLRIENDASSDADATAKRRGRIAELKDWLALLEQTQLAARDDIT
jgi:hypothetical protein